jgi:hypothetical protein
MSRRPSVVDPDEQWYMPDQLYVAANPDRASGGPSLTLYGLGEQGQQAILAYSSLNLFISGCGADQPWILVPSDRISELAQHSGDVKFSILMNQRLPQELRGRATGLVNEEPVWSDNESEDWMPLYIPSRPFRAGDKQALFELQPMPGDRLALMLYSSQRSLTVACGPQQPWVSIPAGLISEARRQSGAHTICLDTPLPEALRHGSKAD